MEEDISVEFNSNFWTQHRKKNKKRWLPDTPSETACRGSSDAPQEEKWRNGAGSVLCPTERELGQSPRPSSWKPPCRSGKEMDGRGGQGCGGCRNPVGLSQRLRQKWRNDETGHTFRYKLKRRRFVSSSKIRSCANTYESATSRCKPPPNRRAGPLQE